MDKTKLIKEQSDLIRTLLVLNSHLKATELCFDHFYSLIIIIALWEAANILVCLSNLHGMI